MGFVFGVGRKLFLKVNRIIIMLGSLEFVGFCLILKECVRFSFSRVGFGLIGSREDLVGSGCFWKREFGWLGINYFRDRKLY